jgi:8-oxo-dGTP pyrophosphatase MutT (NUDIX family)
MTETEQRPRRAARPRDAATLILMRRVRGQTAVLIGKRHQRHRFMPDVYVFPGGRVDRADQYVKPVTDFDPHVQAVLERSTASPAKARAAAMAAIRETFEETGLVVGRRWVEAPRSGNPGWRDFFKTGYAPALDGLTYICRAITPPFRPQRFNARFFVADGEDVHGDIGGSGELLDLDWVPVDKAVKLEVANITRIVLERLAELGDVTPADLRAHPVPFYRTVHGKRVVTDE